MKNIFGSSSQPAQRRSRTAFSHVPAVVEVMEPRQLLSAAAIAPNDTAALDAQIDALTAQQSSITLEKTDVQSQLIAATKHLQEADANLATAEATLSQAGLTLEQKQAALHTVDAALIQAMNSVNAADSALKEATDLIAHDTKQMNIFQGKLNAAIRQRSQFSPRSGMYWALSNTVNNLQSHVTGNARRVRNGTAALPPLQDRAGAAHANLASMQLKKATADTDVAAAQQQYDGAFAVDVSAKSTRDSAQETVDTLTVRLSSLQISFDAVSQELAEDIAQKTALEQVQTSEPVFGPEEAENDDPLNTQESDALVQSLTASVTAALSEESEKIGYAKMFVSHQGNVFTVRFRNPGATTNIEVKIDNNDGSFEYRGTDAAAPVKDGSYSFTMNRRANAGGQGIRIRMYDATTREVLGEVRANYNNDNNNATIDTVQTSFDTEEQGMLSENPITPMLKVSKIDGPNILLVAQTPHDQFTVWSDTGGVLSGATVATPGGTLTGVAQITIDTGAATGYYTIGLYDRQGGEMISSQTLHYDKNAKAITFTDSNAFYTGTTIDTAATHQFDAQHALSSLPLGVPDLNLARIQSIVLYQDTAALAAPYNLYVSGQQMLDAFYAANPGLKPEVLNTLQSPDRENAYALQKTEFRKATDSLNAFEGAMSALMQSAINIYLGAQQGQPERPLKDQFMVKWNTNNQDPKLSYLRGLGIPLPNASLIIGAGKEVYQQHWQYLVDMNADFVAYQGAQSNMLEAKRMEDAKGALFGTAGGSHIVIDPSVSVDRIRQAARINDRLSKSGVSLAQHGISAARQQAMSLRVATIQTADPVQRQVEIQSIAQNIVVESRIDTLANTYPGELVAMGLSDSAQNLSQTPNYSDHKTIIDGNIPETLHLPANTTIVRSFSLTQNSMVNLTLTHDVTKLFNDRSASIAIFSATTLKKIHSSNKSGTSGNTISASFPPDHYFVTVTTAPNAEATGPIVVSNSTTLQLEINVKKLSSAKIEGMVSLEGNANAWGVSMSVAEFKNGQRLDVATNTLDNTKPIMVVIHGRTDSPDSNNMNELIKSLYSLEANNNFQVVSVDWRKAAKDVSRIMGQEVGLEDASWTPAVGKWVAQQLEAAGFPPSKIFFKGHSHGSYAAFFAALYIMEHSTPHEKVGGIVVLDSAKNPTFIGADIDEDDIQFKDVARYSLALHSSFLGSIDRSLSAQNTILVGTEHSNTDMVKQHGDSVNAMTDVLRDLKDGTNKNVTDIFSFSPELGFRLKILSDAFGYDALLTIRDKTSDQFLNWHSIDVTGISLRTNTGGWSNLIADPSHISTEGVNFKPTQMYP